MKRWVRASSQAAMPPDLRSQGTWGSSGRGFRAPLTYLSPTYPLSVTYLSSINHLSSIDHLSIDHLSIIYLYRFRVSGGP